MFYRLADTSPKNPNCNCIRPLCAASRREKSSSAQFSADLLVCLTYPCHNHICPGPHRQFQHSRRRNHRHPHHHQWQQQQFTQHAAFYRLLGLLRQRAMCKKCFSLKSCFTILLSSRRRRWRRPGSPPSIPLHALAASSILALTSWSSCRCSFIVTSPGDNVNKANFGLGKHYSDPHSPHNPSSPHSPSPYVHRNTVSIYNPERPHHSDNNIKLFLNYLQK